ncbi:MAG: hypothetical protein ABI358_09115 [Ginsengibacter sp.]
MKKIPIILFCATAFSNILNAQQQTPQLLKQPANWQFEKFKLPPVFAPSFPYKGVEELRFSPGMFIKDSTTYFTYAFAAELDNTPFISQNDIRNYLLDYFKGLCSGTAKDRHLSIDTSKITVAIERKKIIKNEVIYNAFLNIFGVFTDGAPVKLNMEIKVLHDKDASKIYLVFIASPLEKDKDIWQQLRTIQKDFSIQ